MHYMKLKIANSKINQELLKGLFGIEKESLRVDAEGNLAKTEHPDFMQENISRDFGESQIEFISDAWKELLDACDQICNFQKMVEDDIRQRENGGEYIWTYSNPPYFGGEDNIRIAEFDGEKSDKTNYREYLSQKYGKVKMLYSGVHFNYSISEAFLEELSGHHGYGNGTEAKNKWYLNLADRLMNDSWLFVVLTAASPVAEPDFLRDIGIPEEEFSAYASFRNGFHGYWNQFEPELSYDSFLQYCDSITNYIQDESICSVQELYYPIRLKPEGDNSIEQLRETGVGHMELRMLDLNPLACSGVERKDLIFIHLLIAFRMFEMLEETDTSMDFPSDARRQEVHKEAARLDFLEQHGAYQTYALDLLARMEEFYTAYQQVLPEHIPKEYPIKEVLLLQKEKILNPQRRYAVALQKKYKDDYVNTRMKEMKENG